MIEVRRPAGSRDDQRPLVIASFDPGGGALETRIAQRHAARRHPGFR